MLNIFHMYHNIPLSESEVIFYTGFSKKEVKQFDDASFL